MLNHIHIKGYKCLDECTLPLTALTLLAGPNSSGKSTLIQAILLACSGIDQKYQPFLKEAVKPFAQFEDVYCRYSNAHEIEINIDHADGNLECVLDQDGLNTNPSKDNNFPAYEQDLFYICAGRSGPEETTQLNKELRLGDYGQFASGLLEQRKNKPIHAAIIQPEAYARTLKAQLAWWLSFIVGRETEARTEKITSTNVKTTFNTGGVDNITPLNTGAGNSFLLKILIMCLTAKPGDVLLIENPEIHLHPCAQSRLGSLMAFIAERGVQVIVETHCEHLINRVRYEVYKKRILPSKTIIHYKPSFKEPFEVLGINKDGHFSDLDGKEKKFPTGFFDSTLAELLEIS